MRARTVRDASPLHGGQEHHDPVVASASASASALPSIAVPATPQALVPVPLALPSPAQHHSQPRIPQHDEPEPEITTGAPLPPPVSAPVPAPVRKQSPLEQDDWTSNIPQSDHVRFFRETNWSASLLGPLETWSLALRLHTFTLFADSQPACIYWGPSRVAIYNIHFGKLAGDAHPRLMGNSCIEVFAKIWTDYEQFDRAERTGMATEVYEVPLMTQRNGYLEETFFTGNFNPIRDIDGKIGGFYNATHEVTKTTVHSRRSVILNMLAVPPKLHDGNLATYIMPALEAAEFDVTMALFYEAEEDLDRLHLRGSIGVPPDHRLAVQDADLSNLQQTGLFAIFRTAQGKILTLPVTEDFDGVQWRGFKEPSLSFSILPLTFAGRSCGFLVLGANSRRPIDDDHHQFMVDLAAKVSSVAGAVISAAETRERAERLEQQLMDSERQIRYMAQHASVGMQHLSIDGTIIWANDRYYKLTGHSQSHDAQYKFSFIDVFLPEERDKILTVWQRLIKGESSSGMELRLKKTFNPSNGDPVPATILFLAFPYKENGESKSIMVCTTDVSNLKWAETSEARKAEDARQAKKQQEEFIDIVSHEMRNPLSAIFQCSDMIRSSMDYFSNDGPSKAELLEALHSNVDAANIILMCANHQKRIVDDVLTLSKLEYMMLSISPRPAQPATIVTSAVKMFEPDIQNHDIRITIIAEPSLRENNIDWLLCDPSRIAQIFINLLTNAIKFTRSEPKREITIRYGVTFSKPREMFEEHGSMNWAPSNDVTEDLTSNPEWGDGKIVYLAMSVTDSGVGMSAEEIKKMFHRFTQANSKTSIRYGGSGLGLFISQKLTEKQGGEIGVASVAGQGSTFGFFVKARCCTDHQTGTVATSGNKPLAQSIASRVKYRGSDKDASRMHVLLVEDNLVNQKVLSKQLEHAGCTVHIANHGLEALELLSESDAWHTNTSANEPAKHLDIILMDWEMPVMNGLTCSKRIRELEAEGKLTTHLEIIATTANARDEQIQMALECGIGSVMSKPFLTSDLLMRMRERLCIQP